MRIPLTPLRFQRRARRLFGNKLGIVCEDCRFTYAEFSVRCDRLSHVLQSLGVGQGDRVAYLAFNCHRLLEGYYGVVQMGAVLLPLNIRLSKQDFTYILNDSGARVLFFDPEFCDLVADIRPSLNTVETFVLLRGETKAPWRHPETYDQLLEETEAEPFAAIEPDEDDVAEIFYTSGTTANPKGVMLTHRNLYLHALGSIIAVGTRDSDIQLHTIPLFHVNGWGTPQSLTCMGGTHVMLRRFDPGLTLHLLEKEKVTLMSLVPTMANALLNHPELEKHDYSSLRMINIGGAAPSLELIKRMEEKFACPCYTGYGLTETSPLLTLATPKSTLGKMDESERHRRQAMTGWPQVGVELRVVDDDGMDVAADGMQIGQILARSDGVMKGYWNQPEETEKAIRNGWFYTGDMATIDEEGYVLIVDRQKDIIVSGGENISSIEIEKCLASHPEILECAVIAVPDVKWGEVPKALVVLRENSRVGEEELIEFCRKTLAGYKCPRSVEFMDNLPKGGTGKILKKDLREKYWVGQEKRVRG